MKFSIIRKRNQMVLLVVASVAFWSTGHLSIAAEPEKPAAEKHAMSQEKRNRMAESMEKMANCLRSDKAMETCKDEMMASCHESKDECPMMGGGMHGMMKGKGMMHGKKGSAKETKDKKESEDHTEHH
jgi:hypothetical protein